MTARKRNWVATGSSSTDQPYRYDGRPRRASTTRKAGDATPTAGHRFAGDPTTPRRSW